MEQSTLCTWFLLYFLVTSESSSVSSSCHHDHILLYSLVFVNIFYIHCHVNIYVLITFMQLYSLFELSRTLNVGKVINSTSERSSTTVVVVNFCLRHVVHQFLHTESKQTAAVDKTQQCKLNKGWAPAVVQWNTAGLTLSLKRPVCITFRAFRGWSPLF